MRGRPQGRFSTARWQISDCGLQIPSARRRRVRPGRSRSPGGLGFAADWGCCPDAQNHGVAIASFPSLRAGPEGLRRFRQSSLTKLVDIPNGLCYPSRRNGNHANAGAAGGHWGRGGGKNAECWRGAGPGPVANWGGSGLRQRAFSSAGNHAARATRATRATRAPSATYFIYDKKTRAVRGVVEWGNLRLNSLMFAYVRLIGKKCCGRCP